MVDRNRLLRTFLELVQIEGSSGSEGPVAEYVIAHLTAAGCPAERDGYGNVIARIPGTGELALLLNAHLDTVQPCVGVRPVVSGDEIRSEGATILGADNRAGVAVILEIVASLSSRPEDHVPLEVILTLGEEAGLLGAKALDFSRLSSRWGIVMDDHGPVGGCVVSTPWHDVIIASIHGKPAHSGIAPEKGVSAILAAARAISTMPLGRVDEETTSNVGKISGGTAMNIVPARVDVLAEARSRDEGKLKRQTSAMVQAFDRAAAEVGARLDIKVERAYNGYRFPPDEPAVRSFMAAAESLGIVPRMTSTGGGSDANVFHAHGIHVLNLSAGYSDPHTTEERMSVSALGQLADIVSLMARP